jgi:hypothetical protein
MVNASANNIRTLVGTNAPPSTGITIKKALMRINGHM